MSKVRLNIMKKGDHVLAVNEEHVVIERVNGEVDVMRVYLDEDGFIRIDDESTLTIGYGSGSVEVCTNDGVKVETF